MEPMEKIIVVFIAASLLAVWSLWYRNSAATVESCLNNYEACAAAYYNNK